MTKEDIKKALIECNHSTPHCRKCPYFNKVQFCRDTLINDTLEIISVQEKSIQEAQDQILFITQQNQEYREQQVKQAQIDVLNKVKTLIFQKDNPYNVPFEEFISANVFCGYIDELIKEIEDAKSKGTN